VEQRQKISPTFQPWSWCWWYCANCFEIWNQVAWC